MSPDSKPEPLNRSQAEQIAHLLNENNKLQSVYDGGKVLNSKATYLPEHFQGLVFGSVAIQRMNFMLTEIKHLVVHPAFRKMGLAQLMLGKAMARAETPLLFATIRDDNTGSLHLFQKTGFKAVARVAMGDHRTILLLRTNESYRTPAPTYKGPSYGGRAFGNPFATD